MDWAVPVWRSRTQSGAIATSLAGGATVAERIAHDHRAGRPPHCTISVLPLSGSGQSRRFCDVRVTSAYAPRAAPKRTWKHFAFVPGSEICTAAKKHLLDNLVGKRDQRRGKFDAKQF